MLFSLEFQENIDTWVPKTQYMSAGEAGRHVVVFLFIVAYMIYIYIYIYIYYIIIERERGVCFFSSYILSSRVGEHQLHISAMWVPNYFIYVSPSELFHSSYGFSSYMFSNITLELRVHISVLGALKCLIWTTPSNLLNFYMVPIATLSGKLGEFQAHISAIWVSKYFIYVSPSKQSHSS